MKLIAFYLPQYHRIKENDEWWGEGYTEWTNVKKGVRHLPWQNQPRVPLGERYYDLKTEFRETLSWQISIAKENGIYGFCYYHYWFEGGKKLLEEPIERFLEDESLNFPFCICWANEPWTRVWDGSENEILMKQGYGDEKEWEAHFYYLLPFLKDRRYISVDDKPIVLLYRPELIEPLTEMINCWRNLAKQNGIKDLFIVSQGSSYGVLNSKVKDLDTFILYEPGFTQVSIAKINPNTINIAKKAPILFMSVIIQHLKVKIARLLNLKSFRMLSHIFDYDLFWKWIIKREPPARNVILGAFVDWDNTARRKEKGARIFRGSTPEKFEKYLSALIKKATIETRYDYIFINAWNEWGEGTYLEPDEVNGFGYLISVKRALKEYKNPYD